jgi:hypothetical protein
MATNPLTYLPNSNGGLTFTPSGQSSPTTSPASTANREGLRFPAPKIGSPYDLKGAGFGKMNAGMDAVFNGTIKTKSGQVIPNLSTQMYNMMDTAGSGASNLTYTPGTGTTPSTGTGTTPPPAPPPASHGLPPLFQQMRNRMGQAQPPQQPPFQMPEGFPALGGMQARHRVQEGSPKWRSLMSSMLSR